MKMTNFNWGDDIIDSRDIILRYEELNDEIEGLEQSIIDAVEDCNAFVKENGLTDYSEDEIESLQKLQEEVNRAKDAVVAFNQSFDKDELDTLTEVISQGENCSDWSHGEALIRESYFTDYIKDLIDDCYDMPKEFKEGKWPFNHLEMNWESAAEEAKQDYMEIEVYGETYYIRA